MRPLRVGWHLEPQWIEWRRNENSYHVGFEYLSTNVIDNTHRHELSINAQNSAVMVIKDPSARGAGDAFIDFQFPLHSGRFLGLPGRIIICMTGLVTAVLALTGVWIWVKRRLLRKNNLKSRMLGSH